jgi:hypothetical protein
MRPSAVILLVLENFRSGESHHRQKLSAEMPLGVPEKFLWRGHQTTDQRAFHDDLPVRRWCVANRLDDLLDRVLLIVTGNDDRDFYFLN